MELLIATRNAGKKREFAMLLDGLDLQLVDLSGYPESPEVAEDAAAYVDNARAKAVAAARHTGLVALADDSGLEVDFLQGAPGVRSARFADDWAAAGHPPASRAEQRDQRNVDLLLHLLDQVPPEKRTARFRCAIVVAAPAGAELSAEASCEGEITRQRRGVGGFGYDPVFFYPPRQLTFGEMPALDKQRVSHRANAAAALRQRLAAFLAQSGAGQRSPA